MRSRTSRMVSRAIARAARRAVRQDLVHPLRLLRSARARSRIGASVAIMLSASTRLQSRQPHPAPRHFSATSAIVSGGEKCWWR